MKEWWGNAPSDFTEMVGMGVHLEEAVREGRLINNESSSNVKKPFFGFVKNKEGEPNNVSQERRVNTSRRNYQLHQQVSSVTPIVNMTPTRVSYQRPDPQGSQGKNQRIEYFESIPMSLCRATPSIDPEKVGPD